MKKHHWILVAILFLTFIFRFPSLFEPFWYGDEGIFAAVASNLNQGGILYQDAWDNKPPMIYLTYAAIFRIFGVSMFGLRLVALIVVLTTSAVVYEIAAKVLNPKRALAATFIYGLLTSLRLIEGNLALTEIFMILPITLAVMISLLRNFDTKALFFSGVLIAIGSLYKQVGALEAAALGIFLFLSNDNFWQFLKKGLILTLGFAVPYLVTVGYFASKNLVGDYIFGAYTYYRIYFEESPKYEILINVSKILPIAAAIGYGFYQKFKLKKVDVSFLFFLWTAFSFWGSYFSGRTYGHYLVQAVPSVSLLLASIKLPLKFNRARAIFALCFFVPLIFLTRLLFSDFLSGGPLNQLKYWGNFLDLARGSKSLNSYNDFFDKNVNTIMALDDYFIKNSSIGANVYIWGDYPWLYAIGNFKNPSRYVTSFHVFGVPNGPEEVMDNLRNLPPGYILKGQSSIGYFAELEKFLSLNYNLEIKIDGAQVYKSKF